MMFGVYASTIQVQAAEQLPALGDSASSYVSLEEEYRLGRNWLRQLRASTTPLENPLMQEFVENIIYRLVPVADMPQKDFEFIIIDKRDLNAFAAPGGIIGFNFGSLLFSEDEDEIASILAHELAHLGQRHFARGIEQQQQQEPIAIATLLASILLIATNNANAGFAGLMAGQAASIQTQLAYSRDWEREADRIGIRTLAASGMDPEAMPAMFEQMQNSQRIGEAPPEFLLTHPLTASRIADAADRAAHYPTVPREKSLTFEILKQSAQIRYQLEADKAEEHFTELLKQDLSINERGATLFSLAGLCLEQQQIQQAADWMARIPTDLANEEPVISRNARILAAQGQTNQAIDLIQHNRGFYPGSYLLADTQADLLDKAGRFREAVGILKDLSTSRPGEPAIWKKLAHYAANADMQVLSYQANAEYLYLTGDDAKSNRQMDLAIQAAARAGDFQRQEALKERMKQMSDNSYNKPE
jgi:beta-barrel assembly-enhancing protease